MPPVFVTDINQDLRKNVFTKLLDPKLNACYRVAAGGSCRARDRRFYYAGVWV